MNTVTSTHPPELRVWRFRLTADPGAVAEARGIVRAAICAWRIPVDLDAAVLLTSELVTNAIRASAEGKVTLAIRCARRRLRVDVYDTAMAPPVPAAAPTDAEAGRGLVLVDALSTHWGYYRTPGGKAVYFTLAFQAET
jgi:anti-sigma regulatory factor (Ser/Thr protein kinase)